MNQPLGERVLDACLRRVRTSEALRHDLVLVRDHVALSDCPPTATLQGDIWRIERVTGELTLRDALPDAGRLVAIVPLAFGPPPDISGRAWLGKPIEVRADDVIAGLTGRACEPLPDDEIGAAVVASLVLLRAASSRWSQYGMVTAAEVRSVLVSAELGADDRLDRERDSDLLARWVLGRVPATRIPELLGRALKEAHPRTGGWLAWAARTGDVPGLVAAGALGEAGRATGLDPIPKNATEWRDLRNLVDLAVREAWKIDPIKTAAALATAEKLAHRAAISEADAPRYPLVRAVLDRALFGMARRSAEGRPPDDSEVESLRANLHAPGAEAAIDQIGDLARLSRALGVVAPQPGEWQAWAIFARDHVAWVDLAIRAVRRRLDNAGGDLRQPAVAVLSAAVALRDRWNRAFAETLSAAWPAVCASKDVRSPLPLQHVTRSLVARLADAGNRVFLVVLDGCDVSTFIELVRSLPDGMGLALPAVTDSVLREDLHAIGPFHVAVSPVPTVTSHSRRALFSGEIPGNTALNDTESAIANSSADKSAFAKRGALKDIPRVLLLKGDLGDANVLAHTLATSTDRIVAVVLNAVDDALSSKETTAIGEWNLGAIGGGAATALRVALDQGWTVLVTADHGHTPFLDKDRKVAPSALGARYHDAPLDGAVRFASGALPRAPLHLLTAVGAWAGSQHRGFHGGAGLEEVVVPLAFLSRVEGRQGRPRAPGWWWTTELVDIQERQEGPSPSSPAEVVRPAPSGVSDAVRAVLTQQPTWSAAVERLAEVEVLSLAQLSSQVGRPLFFVGGMMSRILAELARAGVAAPFTEDEAGGERVYRWRRGDG